MAKANTNLLVFIVSVFLSWIVLHYSIDTFVVKLENVAFGEDTTGHLGGVGEKTIHCMYQEDSDKCINSYSSSDVKSAVLWVGNSQLPGINLYKDGDENAPQLLHKSLIKRDHFLLTYSQPNANLLEHALVVEALEPQLDLKLLIMPIVFDDLREIGIREGVANFALNDEVAQRLLESPVLPFIENYLPNSENVRESKNAKGKHVTLQTRTENRLDAWLSQHSELWSSRNAIRGTLAIVIHTLRNKMLGIHSYTKRSVNISVFEERMVLLETLLQEMKRKGVEVLLYVPPYRDDIDGPYIESQYSNFKRRLAHIAIANSAQFVNFESVVPGFEWGTVTEKIFGFKEPDFMHFTAGGHERFATAVDTKLQAMGY